jgi:AbrB family looped-hinge helix DNA binding protein
MGLANKYYSKVTSKGQITIPNIVRNNLNIPVGSRVELIQKDNCVIVVPINNLLSKLKRSLPKPEQELSCEDMNKIISNRVSL